MDEGKPRGRRHKSPQRRKRIERTFVPAAVGQDAPGSPVLISTETPQVPRADGPVVEIDSSPVYELLLGLLEFGFAKNGCPLACGAEAMSIVPAHLPAEVVQAFDELAPRCWLWHSLLFMAWELRASKQALHSAQFIERVRTMDAQQLFDAILGCRGRAAPITHATVQEAISGNAAALSKIARLLIADDPAEEVALRRFLSMSAQRLHDLLGQILDGWYRQVIRPHERELANRLANEARTKRIIGRSAPTRLLRASAIGIHYLPRRAVRRVLLIPSVVCRPSVVTIRFGSTRIFFYPLPEEHSDDDALASRLIKTHAALADRERLRILQLLLRGEGTLDSLTRELGLPQQVVRAQLIILRDAGLVMLRMDERRSSFEIRPNLPSIIFRSLQALLPEAVNRLPAASA